MWPMLKDLFFSKETFQRVFWGAIAVAGATVVGGYVPQVPEWVGFVLATLGGVARPNGRKPIETPNETGTP